MKKFLFFVMPVFLTTNLFSQVGIGTDTPNTNSILHMDSDIGTKGVLLPKITNAQQATLEATLGANEEGLAFYNIDSKCVITWKGDLFNSLCEPGKAEYTLDCSVSSIEGTYRAGFSTTGSEYAKLSLNVTKEGPYDISGTTGNGYYFSASGYLVPGLVSLIVPAYNTPITGEQTDTVVFRNNLAGSSLCSFTITVGGANGHGTVRCASILAPDMIVGQTPIANVQVTVDVTRSGPITLTTDTQNGVYYEGYMNFATTGPGVMTLEPKGIPTAVGNYTYTITGADTPCTFPVNVVPDVVAPIGSPTITVNGNYVETIDLSAEESIQANTISFPAPGGSFGVGVRYVSGGDGDPGLSFSQFKGTANSGGQTFAPVSFPAVSGTIPSKAGTYTYQLYDIYTGLAYGNNFTITVGVLPGSFDNPKASCQDIFDSYNTATKKVLLDGEYWIQGATKYKTRCDMVFQDELASQPGKIVGGYTLIWSYSEKTNLNIYGNGTVFYQYGRGVDLISNKPQNVVTTQTGTINYFNYRISQSDMAQLSNRIIRARYAMDPQNTDTDTYMMDNYLETSVAVRWLGNTESWPTGSTVSGKYAGHAYSIAGRGAYYGTITIDGVSGNYGELWLNDGYGSHFNVNLSGINNMWGFYGENELDQNSPFGKCKNPTNITVAGVTGPGCNGSSSNAKGPHPGINGDEGYVQQWWVK